MRLPKRVPWSNSTELEQLCSWIYAEEDIASLRVQAVNRLSSWKASTALPHALESLLSLLVVILQDECSSSCANSLALRQSYSLALIRLVNGLVDPFQHGAYARSIATIAAQIGFPLWLVDLRHASTHENLPSLEMLREGAKEAMTWLLHNYFLPAISPSSRPANPAVSLSPFAPILTQYKQLLKVTTRDVSLKSRSKPVLIRILREVDSWISEAKVAASLANFSTTQYGDDDDRERWALERLCDALVGRGGLVPISRRKRLSPSQPLAAPSAQNVALWSPLLLHVYSRYPNFPSVLLFRIIAHILPVPSSESQYSPHVDPTTSYQTYEFTLASWALWIVGRWGHEPNAECEPTEVIIELLVGLGRGDRQAARALATALSENHSQLRDRVALLSTTMLSSGRVSQWEDDTLEIMSSRLSSLQSDLSMLKDSAGVQEDIEMFTSGSTSPNTQSLKGWKLLEEGSGWRPCPIGVYIR